MALLDILLGWALTLREIIGLMFASGAHGSWD